MGIGMPPSLNKNKKRDQIKQYRQEISANRRKGILDNIGLIIGKSLVSQNDSINKLQKITKPKVDLNLKKLEQMLSRQITKFKVPNKYKIKESSPEKLKDTAKKSRNGQEKTNKNMMKKVEKIDKDKLDSQRSDKKLQKTLKTWGVMKAQREQKSLEKLDKKAMMHHTARNMHKKFKEVSKYNRSTYFRNYPAERKSKNDIDSDTSFSQNDSEMVKKVIKCATEKTLPSLPKITRKKKFIKTPKVIDFSSNLDEMNANQLNENGKPHFDLKLDNEKFLSLSPVRSKQSQLRQYYDQHLWAHMNDFRQDGKTKIKSIRRKYRNLLSPELTAKKIINPALNIQDTVSETQLLFAKRDHNDKYRYAQLKEINSLKDRLARDGIPVDTKTLRRAILMPEDIK